MRPTMVVESVWKKPRKPMPPVPDLLRGTGMVSVTRCKNQDGRAYLWFQEFESEEALRRYLVSDRRKKLIHETESHYPGGADPGNCFEKRSVRNFSWVVGQTRK